MADWRKQRMDEQDSKMIVCPECGDYSYAYQDDPPWTCSVCAEYGMVTQMVWATPQQKCTACNNMHSSDFRHTCELGTEPTQEGK